MSLNKRVSAILPVYGWIPLIAEFILNSTVYGGAKMIAGGWHHYNMETALDQAIPFLPWTLVIYFGCYLFWITNYVLTVRVSSREDAYRFLSADFLAKLLCFVFFLLLPTTNTRPEITGDGMWDMGIRFLYWIDSADNLFPSIHCLMSWMCYIGIRKQKSVPAWYRTFSCLMAVAVFISTLTTKQHVLVDVAGGVFLAEICYLIAGRTALAKWYGTIFDKAAACVFGKPGKTLSRG